MSAVSVRQCCEHVFVESRDGSPLQKCYRCGLVKPAEEFNWRRRAHNQRDTYCRPCRSAYKAEHYRRNKQVYVDRARARTARLRLERTGYLLEYLAEHPCVDCGLQDPLVLEFDHLGDKCFDIGQGFACRNWESILAERLNAMSFARTATVDAPSADGVRCATCSRSGTPKMRADDQTRTDSFSLEG